MFLLCYPMGMVADYLRFRDLVPTVTSRKLFNSIGMIGPGLCMVLLGFAGCNSILAIGILVVSTGLSAGGNVGFNVRMCKEKTARGEGSILIICMKMFSDEPC